MLLHHEESPEYDEECFDLRFVRMLDRFVAVESGEPGLRLVRSRADFCPIGQVIPLLARRHHAEPGTPG